MKETHLWETQRGALKPTNVSTKQRRIAELAKLNPGMQFTSLNHYIDLEWLHYAYELTRKDGATGVDDVTGLQYKENLNANLESLLHRMKSGTYRAPSIRRTYVPKSDGTMRPLGIPTFEDKVAQRAILMLLEPLYEQDFYEFSYGFRTGRSAHDALCALRNNIMDRGGRWILDVDLKKYFDTIDKRKLRQFLQLRVTDGVVTRLIDKWLKAGILEQDQLHYSDTGTPQGGVLSPCLANVYLHYVLDDWFAVHVTPRLRKRASLVRYCDDYVVVFESYQDCLKVAEVLPKRLGKYGLSLNTEKTRIVDFRFQRTAKGPQKYPSNFSFLGFTHVWGKSRRGKWVVYQQTAKDRASRTLQKVNKLCRSMRHKSIGAQRLRLTRILLGHYNYFGITGNMRQLQRVAHQVRRLWHKWLSRRDRDGYISWDEFGEMFKRNPLPAPRIVHQSAHGR